MVARALADESGDLEFVGAVMDITRRKRAEEAQRVQEREREEMQRQLQQAAKMEAIGRLAGGIAHDFNNILGAILGYGELAQNNLVEGGAVRRQIDQVMQAGARGKALVDRILAFSRSGMGERATGPCSRGRGGEHGFVADGPGRDRYLCSWGSDFWLSLSKASTGTSQPRA